MKKVNLLFLVVLSLGFIGKTYADVDSIKASNNQLRLDYVNTNVDYTEKIDGNVADTEKGHVPGFGISVSLMKDIFLGNDYFYAEFVRLNGNTNYDGSLAYGYPTSAPGYGSYTTNHRAQMTDINFRYGKGFEINEKFMITPYLEIGHHSWVRDFSYAAVGACTFICGDALNNGEQYNNSHAGVGSLFQYTPTEKLVLTGNALIGQTYMSSISGKGFNYVVVVPIVSNGFSPQHLGSDIMYKNGVAADYAFSEHVHGNLGLNYVDFKYGKSSLFNTYNYEPDSQTKYTTLNVGIGYAF